MNFLALSDKADDGGKSVMPVHDVEEMRGFRLRQANRPLCAFANGLIGVLGTLGFVDDHDPFWRTFDWPSDIVIPEFGQGLNGGFHALFYGCAFLTLCHGVTGQGFTQNVDERWVAGEECGGVVGLRGAERSLQAAKRFPCARNARDKNDCFPVLSPGGLKEFRNTVRR